MIKFKGYISVRGIFFRNDGKEILIMKETEYPKWEIPGGRMHVGETAETTLARETQEELGMSAMIGNMVYNEQFLQESDQKQHLMLVYEATLLGYPMNNDVRSFRWINENEINNFIIYDNCKRAIIAYFKLLSLKGE